MFAANRLADWLGCGPAGADRGLLAEFGANVAAWPSSRQTGRLADRQGKTLNRRFSVCGQPSGRQRRANTESPIQCLRPTVWQTRSAVSWQAQTERFWPALWQISLSARQTGILGDRAGKTLNRRFSVLGQPSGRQARENTESPIQCSWPAVWQTEKAKH